MDLQTTPASFHAPEPIERWLDRRRPELAEYMGIEATNPVLTTNLLGNFWIARTSLQWHQGECSYTRLPTSFDPKTVSLECGHQYVDRRLAKFTYASLDSVDTEGDATRAEFAQGLAIGKRVAAILQGVDLKHCLFVDDIQMIARHSVEDRSRAQAFTQRSINEALVHFLAADLSPDVDLLIQESFAANHAGLVYTALVEAVRANSAYRLVYPASTSKLAMGTLPLATKIAVQATGEKIKLLGKDGNAEAWSCDLLDLCVYNHKLNHSGVSINVLAQTYEAQQARVRTLLPVINIFFNAADGTIKIVPWSQSCAAMAEKLQRGFAESGLNYLLSQRITPIERLLPNHW